MGSSFQPKDCNDSCNDRYGVLDIPWRVYCKKACNSDGESWDDCRADCKDLCHKAPVYKEFEWTAHFDRSPGSPTKSRKCEKACIRGCAFKFNVTAAELAAAIPRKPPPPPPPPPSPSQQKPETQTGAASVPSVHDEPSISA